MAVIRSVIRGVGAYLPKRIMTNDDISRIVDTEERVQRILPILDEMVGEGLVTIEKVHVIAYRGKDRS